MAVETDETLEHPVFAVLEPVRSFDNASMQDWVARRLVPETEVFTDGLGAFRRFADAGRAHTVIQTEDRREGTETKGARWVNIVLSNVKRALDDVYHAIRQGKYARRYLAEAAYRFNHRFRLRDMLPRLARAVVLYIPRLERILREATNFHGWGPTLIRKAFEDDPWKAVVMVLFQTPESHASAPVEFHPRLMLPVMMPLFQH